MGVFEDYKKAVLDVEYNNCTLEELEEAEQRLKDSIIEWHPYPKEKPNSEKDCLITEHFEVCGAWNVVSTAWFDECGWHWENGDIIPECVVTAWAELPKPYTEMKGES